MSAGKRRAPVRQPVPQAPAQPDTGRARHMPPELQGVHVGAVACLRIRLLGSYRKGSRMGRASDVCALVAGSGAVVTTVTRSHLAAPGPNHAFAYGDRRFMLSKSALLRVLPNGPYTITIERLA